MNLLYLIGAWPYDWRQERQLKKLMSFSNENEGRGLANRAGGKPLRHPHKLHNNFPDMPLLSNNFDGYIEDAFETPVSEAYGGIRHKIDVGVDIFYTPQTGFFERISN